MVRNATLALLALSGVAGTAPLRAEEVPRVKPKGPAEASGTFRVLDGFRMDLIAAEPLIASPVSIAYDENGVMYVAEMIDYPEPDGGKPAGNLVGRVRMLLDLDGDGRYETSHVFADGLRLPSSVICWKGGVFVAAIPDIWYLKDTDGDHKADVRRKIYTGFGTRDSSSVLNSFQWGLDHKIYGAASDNGGDVRPANEPQAQPISLRRNDFRFDPLTGKIEAIATGRSRWGNSFDDWGNRFVSQNVGPVRHVVMPIDYLARNPYLKVARLYESLVGEGGDVPVYRASPPEPWRVVRAERRQFFGKTDEPGEINAAGYFTAACGVTPYRGSAYPDRYRGNLFVAEPAGNLIHRRTPTPRGVTFTSERADPGAEMVASSDVFFRPVGFANAPDGTLHVVDMYREVVESQHWVPQDLITTGQVDMKGGNDRGRIYRLSPPGFTVPAQPRLGAATTEDLVKQLENPGSWWRETAARLIHERQDRSAIVPLRRLLRSSARPFGRLQALWALEGLGGLEDGDLSVALTDGAAGVREHAVRLAEPRLGRSPRLAELVLARAADTDPRVRFQVAFTLGAMLQPRAVEGLARIAIRDADDAWMGKAVLSSATTTAGALVEVLLRDRAFVRREKRHGLLGELAFIVGASNQAGEPEKLMAAIATAPTSRNDLDLLTALVVKLGGGITQAHGELGRVLAGRTSPAAKLFRKLLERSRKIASDARASVSARRDAVALCGHADFGRVKAILADMVLPRQPQAVQLAALDALGRFTDAEVPALLLRAADGSAPQVQSRLVDLLLSRTERVLPLLDAISEQKLPASLLSATRRDLLLKHADASVRERATALFGHDERRPRADVIARYKPALEVPGDRRRGRAIFERICTACHRLGDKGTQVGPDLGSYNRDTMPAEALLVQILDPNREVPPSYMEQVVTLKDGNVITGVLATQTETSFTFARGNSEPLAILRRDIDKMRTTGLSLMPEGLEEAIPVKDMADLLAFLAVMADPHERTQ